MKIAVFLDGRPGHEKQSRGIVAALARQRAVVTVDIAVKARSFSRTLLDTLKLFILPGAGCDYDLTGVELLIGTGSRTHLALLACRQKLGVPAVTCMAPDIHLRSRFDLCCVPEHDGLAAADNIFLTCGPPSVSIATGPHDPHQGLILVGGLDPASHVWSSTAMVTAITTILAREKGMHWHISSSPRTPPDTVSALANLATHHDNCIFFPYSETAPGWIEEQYRRSTMVWVTADSMSMIYEALSAGCRVGSLPVAWKKTANKFQRSEEFLAQHKYIVTFSSWENGQADWAAAHLNEAERCAQEILRRWFPKN